MPLEHIEGRGLGAARGLAYIAHVVDMKVYQFAEGFEARYAGLVGVSPRSTWRSVSVAQRRASSRRRKVSLT
ncbi:hypothetical protein NKH34_28855 [Mesorhizobium sp. M1148]|uniref:hypothetical protein n=2 Tax=Mesorhizobium TaxID=68287 RepID=UPI001FD95167|nr:MULTISPECIES: hypothetical protein [unclassified Mesorhizobium]